MDVFTRKGRKLNRWTFQYFFAESNAGVNLIFFYRRVIIVLWHKDVRIVRCMSRGMTRGFDQSGCFISGFFTTLPIDKNLFTMAYCCCYRCCIFKLKSWARNNELNEGLIPYVHFHKQNGCLALAMTCTSIFPMRGGNKQLSMAHTRHCFHVSSTLLECRKPWGRNINLIVKFKFENPQTAFIVFTSSGQVYADLAQFRKRL